MFSQTIIMGHLVFNPELESKEKEGKVIKWVQFRIAVNRDYIVAGQPTVDFYDCIVFNRKAEFLAKYARIGTELIVVGRLEMDSYINKENRKIPTIQLRVREQKIVSGWKNQNLNKKETDPERKMTHSQDYPAQYIDENDYESYVLPFCEKMKMI